METKVPELGSKIPEKYVDPIPIISDGILSSTLRIFYSIHWQKKKPKLPETKR